MHDLEGREVDYLRISITDRCNLRCIYCIPQGVTLACCKQNEYLTKEELFKVVKVAASVGITKVKLTGGEPLLRKDIVALVKGIKEIEGIQQVTLTTNGILLDTYGKALVEAGIDAVNISLDTLNRKKYAALTGYDGLSKVLKGIHILKEAGLKKIKLNAVPLKDMNEQEISELVQFAKQEQLILRFIELMPFGGGKAFLGISKQEIIEILERNYGTLIPYHNTLGNGPAQYYTLQTKDVKIGFIHAVSQHFCNTCNRVRITCEGYLKLCLHSNKGIDLKPYLASSEKTLEEVMRQAIQNKPKQHQFNHVTQVQQLEDKMMSQIGG
ncbi:GTP 3',8-cyclase MoaA [Niameybacter massiliensis]|uniref:GTP 3',8-cyclase MoaA n=1 Tax=Niameybacter massiliensis TaxID=1658108 RepID=UPI0006B5A7A0|nr:GTP 3',8-cyclase MoaA [Niameybacter massiliensis]